MSDRIPLFIVEDQPRVLKGVLKILGTFEEIELVGTAISGEEAMESLPASGARVALVDIELPGIDGLELVQRLKAAHVACELLILTSFVDDEKVFQAMRRGAAGYLVKGGPTERLRGAIQTVGAGGTVIEPRLAKRFWEYFHGLQEPAPQPHTLTPEEVDLLELVAKGLSNAEAADVLGVARRNVRTQLHHIYEKLGVRSHVEAVVVALKQGILRM